MAIFGTIGIVRNALPVTSEFLAMFRGITGMLVLLLPALSEHKTKPFPRSGASSALLLLSGALIGVNWILLFEAYVYTSVPKATLCYYMAPVFVILLSPLLLREKLSLRQILCAAAAVLGMVPISGVLGGEKGKNDLTGVVLGLGAAVLYASVVLLNKKLADIPPRIKTAVQLGAAGAAVLPYVLITKGFPTGRPTLRTLLLLAVVGLVHTGLSYLLYFGAIPHLSAQTAAMFSYIDPVVAILLSAALGESLDVLGWIGAVLILGSTLISTLEPKKAQKTGSSRKIVG